MVSRERLDAAKGTFGEERENSIHAAMPRGVHKLSRVSNLMRFAGRSNKRTPRAMNWIRRARRYIAERPLA
jgi:hypothetical protein